jgi:hypothetical protein
MSPSSHAGDNDAESYWRWRCRVCAGQDVMSSPSHVDYADAKSCGDGTTESVLVMA